MCVILNSMNRPLIITIGIVVILLVLGVWVYLMLFGTPEESDDVFSNLGFEFNSQGTTIAPPANTTPLDSLVDTQSSEKLRQLTTRPVAGFAFASTSVGDTIRYVERGTGHVYEINLESGEEEILSRTTIPQVSSAVFSPGASTIAFTSYNNYQSDVFVGTIGEETNIVGITLQPNAQNIAFSSDSEILYSVAQGNSTTGYRHDIQTFAQTEVFSFNYTNLDVAWGGNLTDVYLSTKPAHDFEGFIYRTQNDILTPATFSAYGLSALIADHSMITTYIANGSYTSAVVTRDGNFNTLPILAMKEKCVFDAFSTSYAWCAAPLETGSPTFVEDWYKGTMTSEDYLWLVDTNSQSAQLYANPTDLAGRAIDIKDIAVNAQGNMLSFTNKIDQTLWVFDLVK